MNTIEDNGFLFAQCVTPEQVVLGKTIWFGKDCSPLQGSLMCYNQGKSFRTHAHILNPRIINKTQECFIVVLGCIRVTIAVIDPASQTRDQAGRPYRVLGSLVATQGSAIFVWGGFHKIEILEDHSVVYEIKAGQFNGVVSDDKEFLDE